MRVALLSSGHSTWIAGRIYIHNLARALAMLSQEKDIQVRLLLGPGDRGADHSELGRMRPMLSTYAYRKNWPLLKKLTGSALSFIKNRPHLSLEQVVRKERADILFPLHTSPGQDFPVPWIGWIPDFQHKRLPDFFTEHERQARDIQFSAITRDASRVVVSSEDARQDLLRWFPIAPDRVSALPFATVAPAEWYAFDAAEVAALLNLPSKYLIFPSQFWVHKNHAIAFEALRILRDRGLDDICLVCTGYRRDRRCPEHFDRLKQWLHTHHMAKHVRILGLLPRLTQVQLMRRAVAVLQPSLFEGWSSLLEDARALGKRIYVSDIPVHHEQNPPNSIFFAASSAINLADVLAIDWPQLQPGPNLESERIARSMQLARVKSFAENFISIAENTSK